MDEFDKLREEIEKLLTSKKTILLLVRHGETEANFTKQLSGWHDVQLTQKGIEEGKKLSKAFQPLTDQFAGIYCSDLSRARVTAESAIGTSDKIVPNINLRELNFGDHQNAIYSSQNKAIYDILFTMQYQAPNGENWEQLKNRIMNYMESVIKKSGVYVIFTHGGAIFSLVHQFGFKNTIKNCSCLAVELDESHRNIVNLLFYWQFPNGD